MDRKLGNCDGCKKEIKKKHLKKLNSGRFCDKCCSKKRLEHREYLKREILHIRKRSDILKEYEERKKREGLVPKIAGSKSRIKGKSKLFLYLTKLEKDFLWKKYIQMGMNPINIYERIKYDVNFLQELVSKLRDERKTDEEINKTFKEEFAKLIMENGQ